MNELDNRRRPNVLITFVAQRSGNQQDDKRSEALAATHYDVLRDLRYQRNVAFEAGRYQPVDGTHIVFGEDSYTVEADGFWGFFGGLHEMRDNA